MNSFKPYRSLAPQAITLDGSTQIAALPQMARSGDTVRIVVSGTSTARVQPGKTSQEASSTVSTGSLMLANSVETFSLDEGISYVAVSGTAGSSVEIQMGTGL